MVTSSVWCSQWASLTGTRRRLSGITRKCPSCTGCQWYYLAALQQRQPLVLDAAYCRRCSVICVPVCLSVCLSVEHNREPYKTTEPIEVIYGLRWTQETTFWVEHRILPREGALFGGGMRGHSPRQYTRHTECYSQGGSACLPAVDKLNISRKEQQRYGLWLPVL